MDENMNELIPNLVGLWIECCEPTCKKWRYVADFDDPLMVPEKWYCRMNSDRSANTCSAPESVELAENEVFVESKFKAGSIVWAKVLGHPWSPAMVDFCPDFESFYWFDKRDSNIPVRESNCNKRYVTLKTYTVMALRDSMIKHLQTQYHVKFFADKNITRAWIKSDFIKPFIGNDEEFALKAKVCGKKLTATQRSMIIKNCKIARSAMSLSITQRLKKYSYKSWKLSLRLQNESNNSQNRSSTSRVPSRNETSAKSKTESDKKAEKCSTSKLPISKTAEKEPKRFTNQKKIIPKILTPTDKASQKYSMLTASSTDTWSSDATRTYNDSNSFSSISLQMDVTNDYSVREKRAASSKRHAIEEKREAGEHRQTNVLTKKKLLSIKESETVFERNKNVIESSQGFELESELQIVNNRETKNGKKVLYNVENEETRDEELPDWIPSSPQPGPSRLSLKLKSMNEKMRRDSGSVSIYERRSLSERISRNDNKENDPQESKYLKTLSKLSGSTDEPETKNLWSFRPRSSLAKRKLPDVESLHKKLLEWQDQSMDKLLSDVSDELGRKMRQESRENLIAEYSSQVGTSSKTVKTAAEIRDHSAMIAHNLLTSDESFTSGSSF